MAVFDTILVLFKKPGGWLIPNNITRMSSMTLLNLLDIDMVSGPSSGLVELLRIWRNLKVANICLKMTPIPHNGATGAIIRKVNNLLLKEYTSDDDEAYALAAGHASAIKLKNAKAAEERESG
jgi:hypothetical protein